MTNSKDYCRKVSKQAFHYNITFKIKSRQHFGLFWSLWKYISLHSHLNHLTSRSGLFFCLLSKTFFWRQTYLFDSINILSFKWNGSLSLNSTSNIGLHTYSFTDWLIFYLSAKCVWIPFEFPGLFLMYECFLYSFSGVINIMFV